MSCQIGDSPSQTEDGAPKKKERKKTRTITETQAEACAENRRKGRPSQKEKHPANGEELCR